MSLFKDKCKRCDVEIDFGNYCKSCLMTPVQPANTAPANTMKKRSFGYSLLLFFASAAWVVTLLGACASVFILVTGMAGAKTVFQESTAAALACAVVIIPYSVARAFTGLAQIVGD